MRQFEFELALLLRRSIHHPDVSYVPKAEVAAKSALYKLLVSRPKYITCDCWNIHTSLD
ncbi:hypothetical protein PWM41_002225 [Providencia rettgeri]|nr:hypothetical protein [Providencia rettgeri]